MHGINQILVHRRDEHPDTPRLMRKTPIKALPFLVIAAMEAGVAWSMFQSGTLTGVSVGALLLWASAATAWVAAAYAADRPRWLGKAANRLPLLGPFLLMAIATARVAQMLGVRERSEVIPGLYVGGWPSARSVTFAQLDCTCELPRRGQSSAYVCEPMLDGLPVGLPALSRAVRQVVAWRAAGKTVLVHCAFGHGRSVAVTVAVLVLEGRATSVDEALAMVHALRPGARLSAAQRHAVVELLRSLGKRASGGYACGQLDD